MNDGTGNKRILLTGSSGFIGGWLTKHFQSQQEDYPCELFKLSHKVLTDFTIGSITKELGSFNPTHIIHLSALSSPAKCQDTPENAFESNVLYTRALSQLAHTYDTHVTFMSTDIVFDGNPTSVAKFSEADIPIPSSVYALTKREAEVEVLNNKCASVIRLSLVYGPSQTKISTSVFDWMHNTLLERTPLNLFEDEFRTPIFIEDVIKIISAVSQQKLVGVFHACGPERVSRVTLGEHMAESFGFDKSLIRHARRSDFPSLYVRPADVSMISSRVSQELNIEPVGISQGMLKSAIIRTTE